MEEALRPSNPLPQVEAPERSTVPRERQVPILKARADVKKVSLVPRAARAVGAFEETSSTEVGRQERSPMIEDRNTKAFKGRRKSGKNAPEWLMKREAKLEGREYVRK